MSGRCVGVESAADHLIVTTVRGRRVTSARVISVLPEGIIGEVPTRGRFDLTPVQVTIPHPTNVHRLVELPPMTAAERTEVVRREGAREGESAKVTAWRVVRRIEVDGLPKDQVLVVLVEPELLELSLGPALSAGMVPRAVVTGAIALTGAARALAPSPLDRPTALVHWGAATLTIAVVSDGELTFTRVVEAPASTLDPFDWIPVEIERSIRHYVVLSKGERVEQVMLSVADAASARRIFAVGDLSERLRLSVTNLNALLAPLLPGPIDAVLAPGAFMLAYGAAMVRPTEVPNLVPAPIVLQLRSRSVTAGAVAATLAALVLVGWQAMALGSEADRLRGRLRQLEATRLSVQAQIDEGTRTEMQRVQMQEMAALLTDDPLHLVPPADALREIARLTPADLRLDRLTMTADGQGYALNVTGRVEQEDLTNAQETLSDFYYGLRGSPLFYSVTLRETSPLTPGAAAAAPATAVDGVAESPPPAAEAAAVGAPRSLAFVFTLRLKKLA